MKRTALQRQKRFNMGWLATVCLFIAVQVLAALAWSFNQKRLDEAAASAFELRNVRSQRAIETRIQAYIDALYGFNALFAASDYVDQGEFNTFYDSTNLTEKYPGFAAISYIAKVDEVDLDNFVRQR